MNHTPRSIHTILAEWGRANHALPPNNDALKAAILNTASITKGEKLLRHFSFLPWLSFTLTGLAAATLFLAPTAQYLSPLTYSSAPRVTEEKIRSVYPEPRPYPGTPITDRREFLKTYYNATLRTRRIMDLTRRVQTVVRGFGGRVDATTAAEKFGYVAFAVPSNRFESFSREIRSLAPGRFIVEETRAENLLPQKRSIEEQEAYIKKTLAELNADRDKTITAHTQTIRSLQSRIASANSEIARLHAEVTDNPQRKAEIAARVKELTGLVGTLESSLARENTAHANRLAEINAEIRANETALEGVRAQDKELMDTVATVEGHISVAWISILEIIRLYVPLYWLAALFGLGAIAAFVVNRRRSRLITL